MFIYPLGMPTWVNVRNNRHAWRFGNAAVLQQSFSRYGNLLQLEVFYDGSRASLLFEIDGHASSFVEEMTLITKDRYSSQGSLIGNASGRGSGTDGKE